MERIGRDGKGTEARYDKPHQHEAQHTHAQHTPGTQAPLGHLPPRQNTLTPTTVGTPATLVPRRRTPSPTRRAEWLPHTGLSWPACAGTPSPATPNKQTQISTHTMHAPKHMTQPTSLTSDPLQHTRVLSHASLKAASQPKDTKSHLQLIRPHGPLTRSPLCQPQRTK